MDNLSVVGIGKLGLCFSLTLENAGYNVYGVDVCEDYVATINDKSLKSDEPCVEKLLQRSKYFEASTKLEGAIAHSDIIFVVVATPSLESGRYDHTQVDELCENILALPKPKTKKHFVICCTVMPGYTDTVAERLKDHNYIVSYNPEFIAQGSIIRDQLKPDMVLIGEGSKDAGDILETIYKNHTDNDPTICRMKPIEAEITKISLNCFCTTKIAFANMIGDIVSSSGGDPATVLEAIGSDSRVNHKYLKYGYGYGGPCFPRDNRALSIYADDIKCPAEISHATDKSNQLHLEEQVKDFCENNEDGASVTIESVTYKPGTTILTESQQLLYAIRLAECGYDVTIKDNEKVIDILSEKYGSMFRYTKE